jgi:hypothetical protein
VADARQPAQARLTALLEAVEGLRHQVVELHLQTSYADLEHADLGLQVVHHAIEEVLEHTGQGGHIASTPDPQAHQQAEVWLAQVRQLRDAAQSFLGTHPSEDLETAIKALTIAEGSLHEVAERYE